MFNALVILLFLRSVVIASEQVSCEAAARRLGLPVDGWKIRSRVSNGVRSERCIREVVDLQCAPGRQVYNAETRFAECCHQNGSITWQDEEAKLGFCCAPDHEWSGDISTGEGGCCLKGLVMVDGRCMQPPRNAIEDDPSTSHGGCGCSSKHQHSSTSTTADEAHDHAAIEPEYVAEDPADLGIRYGHCYLLSVQGGDRQIGSNRENAVYTPGGLFQNIPFRVCRSTSDCSMNHRDNTVLSNSRFVLQDQVGRHNDPTGTAVWVTKKDRGVLKMQYTYDKGEAISFSARKSPTCVEGENCGLKMNGLPIELWFTETTCLFYGRSMEEL